MAVLRQYLYLLVVVLLHSGCAKEVELPGFGLIEGTTTESRWAKKTIYQYKGIPFAMPPVGDLRFKPPVPWNGPGWNGTRYFDEFGAQCPQSLNASSLFPQLEFQVDTMALQDEDCLTLNVYTTRVEDGGNGTGLPVMVFVHGGAFLFGSSYTYTPEYLLDEDVILVVPHYRLGALGYLSMKTPEMPGNAGMLDVVLALEWVRDNIEAFGGDPTRVTIFGESAGAATVSLMLFSPLTKGLIHGVIAQSGSGVGAWVTDPDPIPTTQEIARLALCLQPDDNAMIACLRRKTPLEIINAHSLFLALDIRAGGRANGGYNIVWDEAGADSFLPEDPSLMLEKGNFQYVPMMSGTTKHEGSWFLALYYDLILNLPGDLNKVEDEDYMTHDVTRQALEYVGIVDRSGYVPTFLQDKYFLDEEVGNFTSMTNGLIDIMGLGLLKASTFLMAKEMARRGQDSWMYSFNYFGGHSSFGNVAQLHYPFDGGVCHGDELPYLFPMGRLLNEEEDVMAMRMAHLWTSFAINGVPSAAGVDWPPISTSEGPYLKIDNVPQVYDSYVEEEYMIATREGMLKPKAPSSVAAVQASFVAIVLGLALHGTLNMKN